MAERREDGAAKAVGFPRRQVNGGTVITRGWRNLQGSSVAVIPSVHTMATWSSVLLVGSTKPHSKCLNYRALDKNEFSRAEQKAVYRGGAKRDEGVQKEETELRVETEGTVFHP